MHQPARVRGASLRHAAIASVVAVVTAALSFGTAFAQDDSSGISRDDLEILCQVNAETEEDLALCLDVVERILAPDDGDVTDEEDESVAAFEPIKLKGKGDKLARFEKPEDEAAIADIAHTGKGHLAVWSIAADGDKNDLLVNESGKYKGTVLFDQRDSSAAFEISADGKWSATIKPVTSARVWESSGRINGKGDDVVVLDQPVEGLASTTITHAGKGHFGVWAYTEEGRADLLVNESGQYDGEVLLPAGTLVVEITADGKWSMTPPA